MSHKRKTEHDYERSSKRRKDGCIYKKHKITLDEVYFTDSDHISADSKEYDSFWLFLDKYQQFKKTKKTSESSNYDKNLKINLKFTRKSDKIKKCLIKEEYRNDALSERQLREFEDILLLYYDFLQKQKLAKIRKLKQDQMSLPIHKYKEGIVASVRAHQVVVVAGDTGCGKSTQVPQYLLEAGFGRIACTQPRRIACISLAKRVSYESLKQYGSQVAYQVRFDKTRTKATKIVFLTEGLLLRQISNDASLDLYDVIIMDEVHERHVHTDFLLGVIKCILHSRPSLKLILMSATINISLFANYFNQAPVAKVPGRLYPIQMHYAPPEKADAPSGKPPRRSSTKLDPAPFIKVLQMIDSRYSASERGDALIFVSGLKEITTLVEAIQEYNKVTNSWIVLPLHSSLSLVEQDKVFDQAPEGVRKVIVSTNIAETSVTIDGVRFVIDSGKAKELVHDGEMRMARLKEQWVSRASAEQRRGRAGRTGPGVCFRLYSEDQYHDFQEYSLPEIHRVPLQSLVLQMVTMGIPDPRLFPFIEPPPNNRIHKSISFLKAIGALDEQESATQIGKTLAQLPVDLVIGKILIIGSMFSEVVEAVVGMCAGMCLQSVLNNRAHKDLDMCKRRESLESDHGDPVTLLNLLDDWLEQKGAGEDTRVWCKRRGIEEQRLYELMKLKLQFKQLLTQHGLLHDKDDDDDDEDSGDDNDGGRKTKGSASDALQRRQRHADKRRLRQLKLAEKSQSAKRKVLKMNMGDVFGGDDEEGEGGDDVGDLEFRLSNDVISISSLIAKDRLHVEKDADLLKLLLTSGLHPQLAISDEHNSFKPDSEQYYHTPHQSFLLLHPTSILATNPSALVLKKSKSNAPTRTTSRHKGVSATGHQLLAYVTLLETTKPYIINVLRLPALFTLFLLSKHIDVSRDLYRLVFDSWLDVEVSQSENVSSLLCDVISVRTLWCRLLSHKLKWSEKVMECNEGGDDDDAEEGGADDYDEKESGDRKKRKRRNDDEVKKGMIGCKRRQRRVERGMERELMQRVKRMGERVVSYRIRRLLPAEAKKLFRDPDVYKSFMETVGMTGAVHSVNGGVQVTEFLTYDSLHDDGYYLKVKEEKEEEEKDGIKEKKNKGNDDDDDDDEWGDEIKGDDDNYTKNKEHKGSADDDDSDDEVDGEDDSLKALKARPWDCPSCRQGMEVSLCGRLRHYGACEEARVDALVEEGGKEEEEDGGGETVAKASGSKKFVCDECGGEFNFTMVEMITHWKACQEGGS